jgi:hypothetical protein
MASHCFLRYQFPWLEHPILNILPSNFRLEVVHLERGYDFSNTKAIIWKAFGFVGICSQFLAHTFLGYTPCSQSFL